MVGNAERANHVLALATAVEAECWLLPSSVLAVVAIIYTVYLATLPPPLASMGIVYNNPAATTQQQQPYAYLTYLNFGENVVTLLFQLATIPLDINLLITSAFYPKKLTVSSQTSAIDHRGLSMSMITLISTHIISSAAMLPYVVYVATTWRLPIAQPRNVAVFDPAMLYWLGFSANTFIVVPPVAVFFLTLDRLLTLTWGHAYGRREKTLFFYVEITTLATVTLVLVVLTISFEWPLQWSEGKETSAGFINTLSRVLNYQA